ncbi:HYDIN protein, partial [Polypterus senegalus]
MKYNTIVNPRHNKRCVAQTCMWTLTTDERDYWVVGITVNDIPSIFEEHRICKNVNLYQCLQTIAFGGIFVEDENRFIFVNTLVGQQAKAQFKIINAGKIPCDVSLSVKPITSKPGFKIAEIFELEPSRMIILSHSHSFAVVTFSPQSMQCYQCIFEASMEGNFSNIPRPKSLVFDIIGEGNLPQITVVRPAMRTRIGNPLILFSRLLLGHTEKHQLVLKNDGTIPAEINIDLVDENQAFIVNPGPDTQCVHISPYNKKEDILVSENNTHAASLILSPGLSAEFGIFFTPSTVQRYCGSVHIMVVDNQYEDCVVQLVGEGYQDEITLDNISNRSDHIYYGDCHVGKPYQETFTMTNRSNADSMRFEWLSDIPQLKFFPQIGHVHAGCTKNVTITFHSDQPITLSAQIVKCKVTKIVFQQPVDQVPDWDTRMRTVKWLDAARESEIQRTTKKKVIETDSEPAHTAVENTTRELELRVSAACDYAQFTCKSEAIHFKDTLLFQTRVFELSISNTGCVQLEYSWQTTMEANGRTIILNDRHTDSAEGASFTGSRTGSRSVSHPTSTLESVSTMMSAESELPPFSIEPIAGVIDPEEQQVFVIKFSPLELGEFEGEISCRTFNIMNPTSAPYTFQWRCDDQEDLKVQPAFRCLTEKGTVNSQKKTEVGYNEESAFHFLISNTGTYNLDFIWEICGPDDVLQFLKINPLKDKVLPGVQIQSTLTFCPKQFCVIKNAGLCLKILNGPTFNCVLEGSAVTPGIHFSFTKHDFGLNFIYYAGMVPSTQKLCITNKGDKEARIECLFTSTSYLEVACQTEVLQPSGVLEVPITFHPREPIKYHEKVIFQINKFTQQIVEILGHGAEMKIEVEDPNHKSINLGALQVGETVTKVIPVVNKSRISLSFFLCLTQQMLLDSKVLWVSPSGDITLNPSGGRCMVEVVFSPTCRIPPFIEEVMMDSTGIRRSLFVVRGSCQGMEIILDQDYIPFGAVAQRSQATRRLLMQNTGDIGARFKWDKDSFLPDFSIYPDQGYITPGMEVPFEVTFSPKELNQEIRYENLFCSIEGGKTCKLTLTGSCVSATIKEVINFSCQVRGRQTQTVVLPNKTVQPWVLHPIIEGEYWSGPQSFTIEAQQSKPYEITYRPLTMTTEGKKHQGSVFFPFPDGTGQLHMLQGTADPPKPVSTISREVPCKTSYSEMLSVSNWLAKPQRFRVCIEIMKPEKIDITTELKGLDYVDVPASAKRDYKLTFFSYKEGAVQAKVIFQNETNQEYLYYILNFKATPPSAISSIEMVTVVRQSTSATVKVENPLPFPTTFLVDCKQSDVTFPAQLNIPAESEGALMFEYQPLKAGDFIGRLTLLNSDLGAFHYDLILKALPASPEKPLYFRAMLGSSQLQVARFINYCKPKVEFICKSDSPDFSVEKSFSVQPGTPVGTEVGVDVCFEPCHLGTHFLYRSSHNPINMSIEVITIEQRTVTYRVVSMPGDGTCLFHSLCYILHGHIRLTLDIRWNIVSYVLNDWDRFKVWTDDGTGDNYTTQEHYKSEMLKPFTYESACELMAAAELFGCRFQVYRNGQIF